MTEEEWVKQQRPGARVVRRCVSRPLGYRVRASLPSLYPVYLGRRWCKTPERAWAAARARLIHRLLSRMDE